MDFDSDLEEFDEPETGSFILTSIVFLFLTGFTVAIEAVVLMVFKAGLDDLNSTVPLVSAFAILFGLVFLFLSGFSFLFGVFFLASGIEKHFKTAQQSDTQIELHQA